jgi:uncharacterized protein (TIGR02757 family)
MIDRTTRGQLDGLYARYNRREFVEPDPLQFLYDYADVADREIAGLIAASLAFGNVKAIVASVARALERIGSPAAFVRTASCGDVADAFADFRHRWTGAEDLCALVRGIRRALERRGSLNACFTAHLREDDETIWRAMTGFVNELSAGFDDARNSLLPCPSKKSTCKRLNLYLRWMVRRDDVDPGGWQGVSASQLVVPLDVHMHRIARALGFTSRRAADMRTALEVTSAFREIAPEDPVRYDFSLTRLGIRDDTDLNAFLRSCRPMEES